MGRKEFLSAGWLVSLVAGFMVDVVVSAAACS